LLNGAGFRESGGVIGYLCKSFWEDGEGVQMLGTHSFYWERNA